MSDDPKKTDAFTPDDSGTAITPRPALSTEDRIAALIDEAAKRSTPQVAEYLHKLSPILVPVTRVLLWLVNTIGPLYIKLGQIVYLFLSSLPWDLLQALVGLCLCFCGGECTPPLELVASASCTVPLSSIMYCTALGCEFLASAAGQLRATCVPQAGTARRSRRAKLS